jgi:MFS family permease
MILGFTIGLFNVTYQTQNQTLLQILAPRHLRGRVMSIYLLNRAFVPLGALLAGALASKFGAPWSLKIMSSCALSIILFVVVTRPQLLTLKVPFREAADEEALAEGGSVLPEVQPAAST